MKKYLIVTICALSLFVFVPSRNSAYAVSFDDKTVNTATKIVRAVGEKIGIKWTTNSLKYIAGSMLELNPLDWVSFGGQQDVITLPSLQFTNLAHSMKSVLYKQTGEVVPIYGTCQDDPVDEKGNDLNTSGGFVSWTTYGTSKWIATGSNLKAYLDYQGLHFTFDPHSFKVWVLSSGQTEWYLTTDFTKENYTGNNMSGDLQSMAITGGNVSVYSDGSYTTSRYIAPSWRDCNYTTTQQSFPTTLPPQDSKVYNTFYQPQTINTNYGNNVYDTSNVLNQPMTDTEITYATTDPNVTNPPDTGGTGEVAPTGFFDSMKYMGARVVDVYNGITSFFANSVQMMKNLTVGTAGFVVFLGNFFGWLPKEYVTLLSVGFMTGVLAFFLRR